MGISGTEIFVYVMIPLLVLGLNVWSGLYTTRLAIDRVADELRKLNEREASKEAITEQLPYPHNALENVKTKVGNEGMWP